MRRLVLFALCVLPLLLAVLGLRPAGAIVPEAPAPAFGFNAHQSAALAGNQPAGTTAAFADPTLASNGNPTGPAILTAVNSELRIFDQAGNLQAQATYQSLGIPANLQVFSSKVIFHPTHQRFMVVASGIDRGATKLARILVLVSRNSAPASFGAADWAGAQLTYGGEATHYVDIAGLGYDGTNAYLTGDIYTWDPAPGVFTTNIVATFPWANLLLPAPNLTPGSVADINLPAGLGAGVNRAFHLQPVQGEGGAYLVSSGNPFTPTNRSGLAFYRINPANGAIIATEFVDTDNWQAPPNAIASPGFQIQVRDHLEKAVVRGGKLYTSQTVRHSGANLPAIRFYRLGSLGATPPVRELDPEIEGDVGLGQGFYFSSVAPDPRGNTTLVFQSSSQTANHSIYHTRITSLGLVEIPRVALISNFSFGVTQQGLQPWGRYTDAILDPSDGDFILSHAELTLSANVWRTVVQRVPNRYMRVLSPNGGEVWHPGDVVNIEWAAGSANPGDTVRLELSLDGGATWNLIPGMNALPDDGIEPWLVPNTLSIHARVRARLNVATAFTDDSDADFTIADNNSTTNSADPTPDIPIPDNWQNESHWVESELFLPLDLQIQGVSVTFSITHPYPPDLEVYLVHPDGTQVVLHDQTGVPQLGPVPPFTGTPRTYPVPIPPDEGTQQFLNKLLLKRSRLWTPQGQELPWKLRVRDLNPTSIGTLNSWALTVTGPGSIRLTVTKPNGGERFRIGTPETITWTNDPNNPVQGNVDVILDRDGDFGTLGDQTVLGTVPVDTGFLALPNVTGPETTTARVRVRSTATQFDDSDAPFSILNDFVDLLTPVGGGGTEYFAGQTVPITWDKLPANQNVKIELIRDGTPETLADDVSGTQFDWVVTGPDAAAARIRITSKDNGSLTDESGDFKITVKRLDVTGPTGTVFVDENKDITWNSFGIPGPVKIELTRDADAGTPTWTTLFVSTLNDGTQPWVVTGPTTQHAKIRITSVDDPTLTDEGPEFIIGQAGIVVTSPLASDNLAVGKKWRITWTASAPLAIPDATSVKIEVRRGLGPWEVITPGTPNDGEYIWGQDPPNNTGIPGPQNPPGQTSVIRITSLTYPSTFDESDPFRIVSPAVQVTRPTFGEGLGIDQVFTIRWIATPPDSLLNPSTVSISLSRDNGMTFAPLAGLQNVANDGAQDWTVSGPPTTQAIIRIAVDGGVFPSETDDSDVFRIDAQQIEVTEPHLGEQLFVGTSKTIQWAAVGVPGNVRILIQRPGEPDQELATGIPANQGSYPWNPVTGPATGATVRIESVSDPGVFGVSDTFDIRVFGLTITSPAGTPQWGIGTNRKIRWTFGSGFSGPADVYIRHAGAMTDTLIGANVPAPGGNGELDWGVTGPAGIATITVRVPNTDPVVEATATVDIVTPAITVTAPAAGQELRVGQQATFNWNSVGLQQNDLTNGRVNISLSRNGGPFAPLPGLQDIANTGTANWLVTGPDSNNVRIRVTSVELPSVFDDSDVFRIVTPAIQVIKPAAGDTLIIGEDTTIEWSTLGVTGPLTIEIQRTPNGPWETLFSGVNAAAGSQAWTVSGDGNGNGTPANRIRIRSTGPGESAEGIMVGTFAIVKPSITVGHPNGGQHLLAGSQVNITWGSTGIPANENVSIELLNNGAPTLIASATPNDGSFAWTVPNTQGASFRIRISRSGSPAASDISNNNFSIVAGTIHVDSPNGGEKLKKKKTATINWSGSVVSAKGGGGTVDIYLSTNGGASYTRIISNTANDGSVNFVPTKSSKKARIKIEWKPNPAVNDASDGDFKIK